jgi:hypothetical protein
MAGKAIKPKGPAVTVTCYCRGLRMQWGGRPPLVGTWDSIDHVMDPAGSGRVHQGPLGLGSKGSSYYIGRVVSSY